MAFIDEFNKLLVKNGKQTKVKDKDKAIIDLANEVANGGDNIVELKKCWAFQNDTYTEISKVGNDYLLPTNDDSVEYMFTTDDREPQEDFSNVGIGIYLDLKDGYFISFYKNIKSNTSVVSMKDGNNNLIRPYGVISILDNNLDDELFKIILQNQF